MPNLTIEDAIAIAVQAHRGQVDKEGQPYILHPLRVMQAVAEHGETVMIVAVLHDVLEDTEVTLESLRAAGASDEVMGGVDAVTRQEDETYEQTVKRAAQNRIGRIVKLADNADNSDETRLAKLPTDVANRLRSKYARAREILSEQTVPF